MPLSAMKPTAAEIVKGIPRTHSAKIPPVTASGTQRKMSENRRHLPLKRSREALVLRGVESASFVDAS